MKKYIFIFYLFLFCAINAHSQCTDYKIVNILNGKVHLKNGKKLDTGLIIHSANPNDFYFESKKTQLVLISSCGQIIVIPPQRNAYKREAMTLFTQILGINIEKKLTGTKGGCESVLTSLRNKLTADTSTGNNKLFISSDTASLAVDTRCYPLGKERYFEYRYTFKKHHVSVRLPVKNNCIIFLNQQLYKYNKHYINPLSVSQTSIAYVDLLENTETEITNSRIMFVPLSINFSQIQWPL